MFEDIQKRSERTSLAACAQQDPQFDWSRISWIQGGHFSRESKDFGKGFTEYPVLIYFVSFKYFGLRPKRAFTSFESLKGWDEGVG